VLEAERVGGEEGGELVGEVGVEDPQLIKHVLIVFSWV